MVVGSLCPTERGLTIPLNPVKFAATLGRDHQCSLSTTASGRTCAQPSGVMHANGGKGAIGNKWLELRAWREELHESSVDSAKPYKFISTAYCRLPRSAPDNKTLHLIPPCISYSRRCWQLTVKSNSSPNLQSLSAETSAPCRT